MRKLIVILLSLLLISFVYGEVTAPDVELLMENDYSNTGHNDSITIDDTDCGECSFDSGSYKEGSYSLEFTVTDGIDLTGLDNPFQRDFTMCTWFRSTATTDGTLLEDLDDTPGYGSMLGYETYGEFETNVWVSGTRTGYTVGGANDNKSVWKHACYRYSKANGELKIFAHNKQVYSNTGITLTDGSGDTSISFLGTAWGGTNEIDNWCYWGTNLTLDEIEEVFESNDCNGEVADSAIFEEPTPFNNYVTTNFTSELINISSTSGGNIKAWWNNSVVGNGSQASPYSFSLNDSLIIGQGSYVYSASIDNGITNISRTFHYAIDFINKGSINFTSDGGQICGVQPDDSSTSCGETNDTTPTIRFNTFTNATCKFTKLAQNLTTLNETVQPDCATTGGTSHICTLSSPMPLTASNDLYISCGNGITETNDFSSTAKVNFLLDIPESGQAQVDGVGWQYENIVTINDSHLRRNLTVCVFNPNTIVNFTKVTINPDNQFGTETQDISIVTNSTNCYSFYNDTFRGEFDSGVLTTSGAVLTENVTMTTNPIKYAIPIYETKTLFNITRMCTESNTVAYFLPNKQIFINSSC